VVTKKEGRRGRHTLGVVNCDLAGAVARVLYSPEKTTGGRSGVKERASGDLGRRGVTLRNQMSRSKT